MSHVMRKYVLLHLCCSQSERSNSVKIQYLFRLEGMLKAFNVWGMGAFLEQTNLSDVFKIV